MAVNNFIPQMWAAEVLTNLHKSLVFGQLGVINRNYEGDIMAGGNTVKINAIGPVTVSDYTKNSNLSAPEELQDNQTTLVIDQQKSFHYQIDDIDAVQANVDLRAPANAEAAYALTNTADSYIGGTIMTNAVSGTNTIGSTSTPKENMSTAGVAYDYLVDLAVKLDESNVPAMNRWAILPPWYFGLLHKDPDITATGSEAADARMMNNYVRTVAGINLFMSNNVPYAGTNYHIIAGHGIATTFAEQIVKVEAYRMELRFADAIKGLHVYAAKVVRPSALAKLIAAKPS